MSVPAASMGTTSDLKESSMTTPSETTIQRAADAIAEVVLRGGDHAEAARAALEAAQPSPAIAERHARLLLTKAGVLPPVHTAWREPLEPFCGNPDGFGPGGHTTYTLRVTCQACNDKFGTTEDELAEWDRWTRDGIPESQTRWSREDVEAYMAAGIRPGAHGPKGLLDAMRERGNE